MGQLVPYYQFWTPAIRVGLSASLRLCGKLHHGENAGWYGNGLVFPARAPERGSMTRRSTTIL